MSIKHTCVSTCHFRNFMYSVYKPMKGWLVHTRFHYY